MLQVVTFCAMKISIMGDCVLCAIILFLFNIFIGKICSFCFCAKSGRDDVTEPRVMRCFVTGCCGRMSRAGRFAAGCRGQGVLRPDVAGRMLCDKISCDEVSRAGCCEYPPPWSISISGGVKKPPFRLYGTAVFLYPFATDCFAVRQH